MSAFDGAAAQSGKLISCGEPGISGGAMLFETMSKMPALERSLKSVVSNALFSNPACGSFDVGLKLAAASLIFVAPRFVPVRTQSCACALERPLRKKIAAKKRKQ